MEAHDCHYGTPLHVACARQHYDCAKVLLNAGEIMFIFCALELGKKNKCHNISGCGEFAILKWYFSSGNL